MSNEVIGVIGLVALLLLIGLRQYIGAAMIAVAFFGIVFLQSPNVAISVIGAAPFANLNFYTLTVVPMFCLMGMVISGTRIGEGLYKAAHSWVGHFRGGLASATVLAAGMLGAITGGAYVSTVVMSKIAMPEMRRYGYHDGLATGSIAAAAPLAIIIPPSIPFIMYGIMTEQPIGKLFISGIGPGVLQVLVYIGLITFLCKRNPALARPAEKAPVRKRFNDLRGVLPMLILFVLVLGTIYTGVCSTTESGALGSAGAFIIAFFTHDMSLKKMWRCFKETASTMGMILLLLVGTFCFISFISFSKIPFRFTEFVTGLDVPVGVIIIALFVMYLILGMLIPDIPLLLLTVPLVYPAMMALGIDPIWLGYFIVKLMALGCISPPIGVVVFILGGTTGVNIWTIFKGVIPFIIADFVILLLCTIFPAIVTFLPGTMG